MGLSRKLIAVGAAVLTLLNGAATFAATYWNTTAGGGYSTPGNWSNGVPTQDSYVYFVNVGKGASPQTISLSGFSAGASQYNFNANATAPLTFDGVGALTFRAPSAIATVLNVDTLSGDHQILCGVRLNNQANQKWNIGANRTFTIAGAIAETGPGYGFTKIGDGALVLSNTNTFTGDVTLNAGTLAINSNTNLGGSTGNLYIGGGTFLVQQSFTIPRFVTLTGSGGAVSVPAGISATFSKAFMGDASANFTKLGAGTINLSTSISYGGATNITEGTLAIVTSSSNNPMGSPRVYIAAGATFDVSRVTASGNFKLASQTLAGSGTVAGPFTASGSGRTIAPGDTGATGALTFTSNFTLNTGATLQIELAGHDTPGVDYDQIVVGSAASTVNITGATLNLVSLRGYLPDRPGRSYTILDNRSSQPITGVFNNLANGAAMKVGTVDYKIEYNVGAGGNDVVITSLPEPASALSAMLALCILGLQRRRK